MDTNTHIISQSTHETRFVFSDFEYVNYHEGIDVYCDAIFCSANDYSQQCTQSCFPIVRRSVRTNPFENVSHDDVTDSTNDVTDDYASSDLNEDSTENYQ